MQFCILMAYLSVMVYYLDPLRHNTWLLSASFWLILSVVSVVYGHYRWRQIAKMRNQALEHVDDFLEEERQKLEDRLNKREAEKDSTDTKN